MFFKVISRLHLPLCPAFTPDICGIYKTPGETDPPLARLPVKVVEGCGSCFEATSKTRGLSNKWRGKEAEGGKGRKMRSEKKKRKRQDQHKSQHKMVEINATILRVTINVNRLNTLEKAKDCQNR